MKEVNKYKTSLFGLIKLQVLDLLDFMGFKSYQENFKREQVNGEILCECDEEVLTNDLGISSKLHRMRIMKVISGKLNNIIVIVGVCLMGNTFLFKGGTQPKAF